MAKQVEKSKLCAASQYPIEYLIGLDENGQACRLPAEQGGLSSIGLRVGSTSDGRIIIALLPRNAPSTSDDLVRQAVVTGNSAHLLSVVTALGGNLGLTVQQGADA